MVQFNDDAQTEGTRLQVKEIVNRVCNYFAQLEQHYAGRGALKWTLEAINS